MKKFSKSIFVFALSLILIIPFISSTKVEAAGLKHIGSGGIAILDTSGPFKTRTFKSKGGDLRFKISNVSKNYNYEVSIWEKKSKGKDRQVSPYMKKKGNSTIGISNSQKGKYYLKFKRAKTSNYRVLIDVYN